MSKAGKLLAQISLLEGQIEVLTANFSTVVASVDKVNTLFGNASQADTVTAPKPSAKRKAPTTRKR